MMYQGLLLTLCLGVSLIAAQRPFYAGKRPIGYPEHEPETPTNSDGLNNRFGEDVTTQRLPIEALGDKDLVDRLSKLPQDRQPFWLLNWQALERHRKNPQSFNPNPQSFPQFPDSIPVDNRSGGSVQQNRLNRSSGSRNQKRGHF